MMKIQLLHIAFALIALTSYAGVKSDCMLSLSESTNSTEFFTFGDSTDIELSFELSDYSGFEVSIPGNNDGAINLTITGGIPPYSVIWSNGESTEDIYGLSEGHYTVWVYDSGSNSTNGVVNLEAPILQTINLPAGWSLISTYLVPVTTQITNFFSEVNSNILVVKDELGNFYWPQYGVNLIGNITQGEGYFINMQVPDTLKIYGELIQPEEITISAPMGWSIIGYIRNAPEPIVDMLTDISEDIQMVKNYLGQIYWPQLGFDNIGDMIPGQGYQVKMSVTRDFNYSGYDNITIVNNCPYHMIDYDHNVYNVVQVGTQCWMKENLNVTHYSDGTELVNGAGAGNITNDYTTKYYFNYGDNASSIERYGKLYTWNSMMNGNPIVNSGNPVQGVCPTGWHVPSTTEWNELLGNADSQYESNSSEWLSNGLCGSDAGGNLKEDGFENWISPNAGATNSTGFSALPAGYRMVTGTYLYTGESSLFWTVNATNIYYASYKKLSYYNSEVYNGSYNKGNALSVRCIMND